MNRGFLFGGLLGSLLLGCSYRYEVRIEPAGAKVYAGGREVSGGVTLWSRSKMVSLRGEADGYEAAESRISAALFPAKPSRVTLSLKPVLYLQRIDLVEGFSSVYVDDVAFGVNPVSVPLTAGAHELRFTRPSYEDQRIWIDVLEPARRVFRHQNRARPWHNAGVYPTGRQPKQVSFTPDGRYLIVTLLDGIGYDLIDLEEHGALRRVSPPGNGVDRGFVESMVCSEKGSFWVSQMTTGLMYEYALPKNDGDDPELLRLLSARGEWTKVLAHDPGYHYLAAANWISGSVVVLDYVTGEFVFRLSGLGAPRGLAFSPDDAWLFVCEYENDSIRKFDTKTWRAVGVYTSRPSAPRHVVLSADGRVAYVSDMLGRRVLALDTGTMTLAGSYAVGSNPNTIKLSPDGTRLFVSCRGPNNSSTYLERSPSDGQVFIFKLPGGELETVLRGGNQPTGLDVSPDGRRLAFTDFLDDQVELYELVE